MGLVDQAGADSDAGKLSAEYLIENYKTLFPPFLSDGLPSADTVYGYSKDIDQYLAWCKENNISVVSADRRNLISYRKFLMDKNLKSTTINHKLVAIREFYSYLIEYHVLVYNPVAKVRAHQKGDSEDITFKFFDKEELKRILESTESDDIVSLRNRAMIMLMGLEGLRVVEIYRLNAQDINFVRREVLIHGKGHNDKIIIRKDTAEALKDYMEQRYVSVTETPVPVFTALSNRWKGKRISRNGIRKCINKVFCDVGLYTKGHSCHTLRHTVGTLVCAATKDLNYVKKTLRHKSLEMASHYSHILKDRESGLSDIISLE